MTVYAVGDIQGCYDPLRRLLDKVDFKPGRDKLWVAGDMVNRGPDSLATLRFLKSLGDDCISVLGNHDLHFLAIHAKVKKQKKSDTLGKLLSAPDCDQLVHWLRHRPFLHHCPKYSTTMTHAGIPPIWTLKQAKIHAKKLEKALQSDDYRDFLYYIFKGDKKDKLTSMEKALTRQAKLKVSANYFTRMRFCDQYGDLDLENKSAKRSLKKREFAPWFSFPKAPMYKSRIIFGHWAALDGKTGRPNIHALDTGCVWGKKLTAMNLKKGTYTSVNYQ